MMSAILVPGGAVAFWLSLSQRAVRELLHERGIHVSHETLRQWNIKFAPLLTEELRHREGTPGFAVASGRGVDTVGEFRSGEKRIMIYDPQT